MLAVDRAEGFRKVAGSTCGGRELGLKICPSIVPPDQEGGGARKTVEAVKVASGSRYTPLKRGANERASGARLVLRSAEAGCY